MAWVTCPHCGFTQIPAVDCLKCHKRLQGQPAVEPEPRPPSSPSAAHAFVPARNSLLGVAGIALALVVGAILWGSRSAQPVREAAPLAYASPAPWTLDLTGRWQGKVATSIAGPPPRPALREAFVETDRSGNIVAAGVTLTDPGHGGAGAGYLTVPNGRERLREISAATLASPRGAALNLDFIPLAPWVPHRDRLWRAVEGQGRTADATTYLLLESLERDYLIQAGVNSTGFLSYVYFAPGYAVPRGGDALSRVIHPSSDNSLRGFRNVVWDLSGSANFVDLHVDATLSGPAGTPDRVILRRP